MHSRLWMCVALLWSIQMWSASEDAGFQPISRQEGCTLPDGNKVHLCCAGWAVVTLLTWLLLGLLSEVTLSNLPLCLQARWVFCAYPATWAHRPTGWCPCSESGSVGWRAPGWMVPCFLMRWAPSGLRVLSYCFLVWTENMINHTSLPFSTLNLKSNTHAATWCWGCGYAIFWHVLALYQLSVQVDDLCQTVIGLQDIRCKQKRVISKALFM